MIQMIAQGLSAFGTSYLGGRATKLLAEAEQIKGDAKAKEDKLTRTARNASIAAQSDLGRALQSIRNQRASKQAAAAEETGTRQLLQFRDATSGTSFAGRLEASANMGAEAVRAASMGVISTDSPQEITRAVQSGLSEASARQQADAKANLLSVRRQDAAGNVALATDFSAILPGLERGVIRAPQIDVPKMGDILFGAIVEGAGAAASAYANSSPAKPDATKAADPKYSLDVKGVRLGEPAGPSLGTPSTQTSPYALSGRLG